MRRLEGLEALWDSFLAQVAQGGAQSQSAHTRRRNGRNPGWRVFSLFFDCRHLPGCRGYARSADVALRMGTWLVGKQVLRPRVVASAPSYGVHALRDSRTAVSAHAVGSVSITFVRPATNDVCLKDRQSRTVCTRMRWPESITNDDVLGNPESTGALTSIVNDATWRDGVLLSDGAVVP